MGDISIGGQLHYSRTLTCNIKRADSEVNLPMGSKMAINKYITPRRDCDRWYRGLHFIRYERRMCELDTEESSEFVIHIDMGLSSKACSTIKDVPLYTFNFLSISHMRSLLSPSCKYMRVSRIIRSEIQHRVQISQTHKRRDRFNSCHRIIPRMQPRTFIHDKCTILQATGSIIFY